MDFEVAAVAEISIIFVEPALKNSLGPKFGLQTDHRTTQTRRANHVIE